MTSKPILFNTEMVQAVLEGRKTQTRRVIKPQPTTETWGNFLLDEQPTYLSPYGQPNDSIWVRETWACIGAEHVKPSEIAPGYTVQYKADDDKEHWRVERWRPSIFMPRWASRITLQLTDVRVKRVQDITPEDCFAEGITAPIDETNEWRNAISCQNFETLWDSINAKRGYGWKLNPWVWVVEFELLHNPQKKAMTL